MPDAPILVLNAGSSSLKFALLAGEARLLSGLIDRLGGGAGAQAHIAARSPSGAKLIDRDLPSADHAGGLAALLAWMQTRAELPRPVAVGHRIVHGGTRYAAPVRIDAAILAELEALVPLAPLHQPHNLAAVRAMIAADPALPAVACFDTGFHAGQPRLATLFALPRAYADRGVRRYGFHGLSYEYIAQALAAIDPAAADGRAIVCHLGAGSSMCAMRAGQSVATTMGFTALDGLPMGTRTGAIDPGVLLHLMETEGLDTGALSDLLYKRSGLLGLSGVSADMRDLLASDRPEAAEAVEFYCYRIAREIGSLVAALGGLDALVFTAGIGEHAPAVRAKACAHATCFGVGLDAAANEANAQAIHAPGSAVRVYVIPTDEERMIARHTVRLLGL
ncbi:MAG: acetate/propionate family kinase [Alphaproteobacteria bacterium]|nr:acetate/propionate family kinase [Alphaproteobacteria bacterium]